MKDRIFYLTKQFSKIFETNEKVERTLEKGTCGECKRKIYNSMKKASRADIMLWAPDVYKEDFYNYPALCEECLHTLYKRKNYGIVKELVSLLREKYNHGTR